jgi:hypothetical protein
VQAGDRINLLVSPKGTSGDGSNYGWDSTSIQATVTPLASQKSYGYTVLTDNPTHYCRLRETSGTTAADIGSNVVAGTYANSNGLGQPGIIPNAGSSEKSTNFANNNYVTVGDLGARPTSGTIEFWATANSIGSYPNVLTTGPTTNEPAGNNAIRFELRGDGNFQGTYGNSPANPSAGAYFSGSGTDKMQANTPYHFVFTWNGTNVAGYVDGVQKFTASNVTNLPTNFDNVTLGAGWSITQRKWDGGLQDVAMYTTALSTTQVATHYSAGGGQFGSAIVALNPIAYWRLNDSSTASGGTAKNYSGAGTAYDGIYGANVTQVDGPALPGMVGSKAAHFEGNGSISVPNTDFPIGNSSRTINLWFETSAAAVNGVYGGLFEYGTVGAFTQTFGGSLWNPGDTNGSAPGAVGVSQWGNGFSTTGAVNDGKWHMLTVTVDSSQTSGSNTLWKIYLDGSLNNSKYMETNTQLNVLGMVIGAGFGSTGWTGDIAEVALFGSTLNADQIQGLYFVAVPEPTTLTMLIGGLVSLLAYAWRKRK